MLAFQLFLWRLPTLFLISTPICCIVDLNNKMAIAQFSIIPHLNNTTNQSGIDSCSLDVDDNCKGVTFLTASPFQTCVAWLTTSNGTAALIQLSQGALAYAERQGSIPDHQMKYVSFTANEPCVFVFRHPKVQIFRQSDSVNNSSIIISKMPENGSAPCSGSKGQHVFKVSQAKHCQVNEFEHLISCNISPNYTCYFQFPTNCNAILGNRDVKFLCLNDNIPSSHKALIVYPPGTTTLDLAQQNIVEINENTFFTLTSLKSLLLDENMLVTLNHHIFNDLITLNKLSLSGNNLKSLPGYIFHSLINLNELLLEANKLDSLHQDEFKGLKRLRVLAISKNELRDLPPKIFRDLVDLRSLDLSENQMVTLAKDLFTGLQNLKRISC